MCSETSDLVPVPHTPSSGFSTTQTTSTPARRDSGGRVGTSVPVIGLADVGGTDPQTSEPSESTGSPARAI